MSHSLLKRYPSLYDLVYLGSYLYESEDFSKCGYNDEAVPPWSAMSRSYLTAKDSDFIWLQGPSQANSRTADRMLFKTCFSMDSGDVLLLLCVRNQRRSAKSPWYAERFISYSEFQRNGQFAGIPEGEWLRNWAVIRLGESHDYFGALSELGKLTHSEERWYFGQNEDTRYPILGNYLRYVFYKLWLDQCICYSTDKQMAAFNTGLVNNKYEFIYAVFDRIPPVYGKIWNLKGFCIAGEQGLGKELLRQFNPVPRPARFFTNTSELIYEINYDLPLSSQLPYVDYSHIIHDNLSRFPFSFLRSACFGYHSILELLEKAANTSSKDDLEEIWENIDQLIDDELFLRIKVLMERALDAAMRRVIWNYKTAIPVYFPARNAISWLLPLALSPGSQADVALVVERYPNGNLEGHTILDLDMAYTNARLISKPESDWLSPRIITMGLETRLVIESESTESAPSARTASLPQPQPEPKPSCKPPVSVSSKESAGGKRAPAKKKLSPVETETKPQASAAKKPGRKGKTDGKQQLSPAEESVKRLPAKRILQKESNVVRTALEVLHSQLSEKRSLPPTGVVVQSMIGQRITLPAVSARKKNKGLQGMYRGVVVTIPKKLLSKDSSFYAGKPMEVVITGVNPQGNQYTAEPAGAPAV